MKDFAAYTHSTAERDPRDNYQTHPDWTRALLRRVDLANPVWEPAAGDGKMVDVLREWGYTTTGTDISDGTDFLAREARWDGSIVTNPPFKLWHEFVEKALDLATGPVALLFPQPYLVGVTRYERIWKHHPPSLVLAFSRRMPIVRPDRTFQSQFGHAWAVWDRTRCPSTLTHLEFVG